MDDLGPSRPQRSAGVEGYSAQEEKSGEKPVEKKIDRRKADATAAVSIPPVEEIEPDQDHKLDERA